MRYYVNNGHENTSVNDADIVIAWSGGVDSTLLLEHLFKKYPHTLIGAIALQPLFLSKDKISREETARDSYIEKHIKDTDRRFVLETISFNDYINIVGDNTGGIQFAYWIQQAYPGLKDGAALYLASIKGDDQMRFITHAEELIKVLGKFYNKTVQLRFPLTIVNKRDMILTAIDSGIIDNTWYCEGGNYGSGDEPIMEKPCTKCGSCSEHIDGMILAYCTTKNEEARKYIRNNIKEILNIDIDTHITNEGFSIGGSFTDYLLSML